MNADITFVVENEHEVVVGAAIAVLNGVEFRRKLNVSWMDMLRKMYPVPSEDEPKYVNVRNLFYCGYYMLSTFRNKLRV